MSTAAATMTTGAHDVSGIFFFPFFLLMIILQTDSRVTEWERDIGTHNNNRGSWGGAAATTGLAATATRATVGRLHREQGSKKRPAGDSPTGVFSFFLNLLMTIYEETTCTEPRRQREQQPGGSRWRRGDEEANQTGKKGTRDGGNLLGHGPHVNLFFPLASFPFY